MRVQFFVGLSIVKAYIESSTVRNTLSEERPVETVRSPSYRVALSVRATPIGPSNHAGEHSFVGARAKKPKIA